jgi:hypothetical protein
VAQQCLCPVVAYDLFQLNVALDDSMVFALLSGFCYDEESPGVFQRENYAPEVVIFDVLDVVWEVLHNVGVFCEQLVHLGDAELRPLGHVVRHNVRLGEQLLLVLEYLPKNTHQF